ncbi:MAG: response regulator receiver protein [Bacteroidota bacterium]|jgi:CheY-like chemotaxis protein|nr:response regulator receiver protein [Bacteroidota bacterium]
MENGNNINNDSSLESKQLKVLLLDDDAIDNFVNQKIFDSYGKYSCRVFQFAAQALAHLIQSKTKYDYLVVDIYMSGMDGFVFIEQLKNKLLDKTQGQIIILTASLNPIDREKTSSLGLKFMEKPFCIENL